MPAPTKKSGTPTFEDLAGNVSIPAGTTLTITEPAAEPAGYTQLVCEDKVPYLSVDQYAPTAAVTTTDASPIQSLRNDLLDKISEQGRQIQELKAELRNVPFASKEGIHAMIMGNAFCPECGVRLNGGSQTGVRGTLYDHDFQAGSTCQYIGRKFKPPTAFLELVPRPVKR